MLVADSRGHMCLRSSDTAKMDPSAADVSLAGWNGSDTHTPLCRMLEDMHINDAPPPPRRRAIGQDGKDVGLVARVRSRSSLCGSSCVSLVDLVLVQRCMLLLKIC